MILTQQEMRRRADVFIERYKDTSDEKKWAQSFWRDFLDIFGIHLKDVAVFEQAVLKLDGNKGFIDCFWKGKLVIEHKSEGKNLNSAFTQALGYLDTLSYAEKPRYIIVSDFKRIRLVDLLTNKKTEISLFDLTDNIQLFSFIYEDEVENYENQEALNIEAAELMGKLHDGLKNSGYVGHDLELLLIRILFCVYAEDTGIFKWNQFKDYIGNEDDPVTVGPKLIQLFRILNQSEEERQNNLPEELADFPYVNGKLFEKQIIPPYFDYKMYNELKVACKFDWSTISPAIFGSLFQSIMNEKQRRNLGAHYTSESNIIKVINSLFMNSLWDEFYKSRRNYQKLELLREKMGKLQFFDPACGCGNFLIIAYRELRLLEYEILNILLDEDKKQARFSSHTLTNIKINNFYGIEIEEFPSMIAKVAMWFIEHQMDLKYETLDIHRDNLPLKSSANITNGNALRIDWRDIVEPSNNLFLLGNPPFVGSSIQSNEQKEDLKLIFEDFDKYKNLDYVTAWYKKSLDYIQGTEIECAFVSTNSICQGQQVPLLWEQLNDKYDFYINFAHQSFKWSNEAKNNAGVYVVIIGFSLKERENKYIYTYKTPTSMPEHIKANQINSYLIDFEDIIIPQNSRPICNIPEMFKGNQPTDGGNLLLSAEEKKELLRKEPNAEKWIKSFVSAREFLNKKERYCLWLKGIAPSELLELPEVNKRVEKVKEMRLESKSKATVKYADYPTLFTHDRQPSSRYILIPRATSENRDYVPMGFFEPDVIVSDTCSCIPNASLYEFGIITSKMHMTWMRYICGRLKGDYRYTNTIVYNTYPFPKDISDKNKEKIIEKAQAVLDARSEFPDESLANLYNPLLMPPNLRKAHDDLDKAVDKCYRSTKFKDDNDRMKFLFDLYKEYTEQ